MKVERVCDSNMLIKNVVCQVADSIMIKATKIHSGLFG